MSVETISNEWGKPFMAAIVGSLFSAGSMLINFNTEIAVMKEQNRYTSEKMAILTNEVSAMREELKEVYGRNLRQK